MKEIVFLFSRLGCLGFGGPFAAVAMMEEEFVRGRKWVTHARFAELVSVCKLFPGPLSTQMAISVGRERGGALGGVVAGVFFILPAFCVVTLFSILYSRTGWVGRYDSLFLGLQAGAFAVIMHSISQLGKPYRKVLRAWILALISAGIVLISPRLEPLVILICGVIGVLLHKFPPEKSKRRTGSRSLYAGAVGMGAGTLFFKSTLFSVFWVCFKAGAFVFGSGLAIVPLLELDAVVKHQWLTHAEFMDGLVMGQITPGPVVITATFIGYKAAGIWGAVVSTIGIFLPSFLNAIVIIPRVWGRWSKNGGAEAFSSWAVPAVVGGVAGSMFHLAAISFHSLAMIAFLFLATVFVFLKRPPSWLIILSCGALTALFQLR